MKTKACILLQLGPVSHSHDWPDYLQYGFTEEDVPELLAIVTDERLNTMPAEDEAVWAPLHAWRALGQLKNPQAVQPLINAFDGLHEDDWAMGEIPRVMAMIGEPAIKPLVVYINESEHDEFARVMAMSALAEVAKQHPEYREQVVNIFRDYMKTPSMEDGSFNGLLVCELLDLDAVELIDDIRQLYNRGCVDISYAGDMEDVEFELGVHSERETPAPDYSKPHIPLPTQSESVGDYFQVVDHYFEKYGHDDSILDVSELDGFFTALACSPDVIMPSQWMALIWGSEFQSPDWESMEEATQFKKVFIKLLYQGFNFLLFASNFSVAHAFQRIKAFICCEESNRVEAFFQHLHVAGIHVSPET